MPQGKGVRQPQKHGLATFQWLKEFSSVSHRRTRYAARPCPFRPLSRCWVTLPRSLFQEADFPIFQGPQFTALSGVLQGGFYFHPTDEDLSVGTPVDEKATWRLRTWVQQLWNRCNPWICGRNHRPNLLSNLYCSPVVILITDRDLEESLWFSRLTSRVIQRWIAVDVCM